MINKGLYRFENEHDACGVGLLVDLKGNKSHQLVEDALTVDILETFAFSSAPVLAIAGADDDVVDPENAQMIVEVSDHPASAVLMIQGADHVFHVLEDEQSPYLLEAIRATGDYFRAQL